MTNPIHVAPSVYDNNIVAGRMRKDSYGRLISTGDLFDVTEEATHAVAYRLYKMAQEEPNGKIAFEYDMRGGKKLILVAKIEEGKE